LNSTVRTSTPFGRVMAAYPHALSASC
jgi:hypothetical protein